MPNLTNRHALLATTALIVAAGVTALATYAGQRADASVPAATPAQQAIPVGVSVLQEQPVRLWSGFSGRLRAVEFAEIRPEVGGRIVEVRLREGQIVNAGDVLFVIDPATYQAAVARAEANLASATTNATFARSEFERAGSLIKTGAVSKSLYDGRINAERVAQAAVEVATAELRQARIDLDHATVRAPIAGRVSRAEITVGNLVQTGPGAPVLTTIASTRGIYAEFEIDEQTYLREIRGHNNQPGQPGQPGAIAVDLTLRGDQDHVYHGQVQSFDNRIDTGSGTIRTRALFANDDGALMPGMTVTLQVAGSSEQRALLVPQAAVGVDQNKKFVYVVGGDRKVAYREVTVGRQVGDQRIVLGGLAAGERVVVDGLQHVRPSSLVDAQEVSPRTSLSAARL